MNNDARGLAQFLARHGWRFCAGVVFVCALFLIYTRYSAMVGGDTYTYANYARLLARGQTSITGPVLDLIEAHTRDRSGIITPVWNTAWLPDGRWVYTVAPVYPMYLALMLKAGGAWLMLHANVFLQVALWFLFLGIVIKSLPSGRDVEWSALVGLAILMNMNASVQYQFTQLWREPLIFALLFGAVFAFASFEKRPRLFLLIPFLLGLACGAKESNIIYAGWTALCVLFHPSFRQRPHPWRDIIAGIAVFAVGCAPLLIQNWSYTGKPWVSLYVLRETSEFSAQQPGAGLSAGNFANTLFRYGEMYRPYVIWIVLIAVSGAIGIWTYRKRPVVWLLAGWFVLHLALYLQWGNADFRHMYMANIPAAIFAALGIHAACQRSPLNHGMGVATRTAHVMLALLLTARMIMDAPARPAMRYHDWRSLTHAITEKINPDGLMLVHRPLRDVVGIYADMAIIRMKELEHATGRGIADLSGRLAHSPFPVYFIDAPDLDPASMVRKINRSAHDWKYIQYAADALHVHSFTNLGRRVERFLGCSSFNLFQLSVWTNTAAHVFFTNLQNTSFISFDPKGLQHDLQLHVNDQPVPFDFSKGTYIPIPDALNSASFALSRKSGMPLPGDMSMRSKDWYSPIILPVGDEARPDDEFLFPDLPAEQPVQTRRKFKQHATMRVPVREGPEMFTTLQVDVANSGLEGERMRVSLDDGGLKDIAITNGFLWMPMLPSSVEIIRGTYRTIEINSTAEKDLEISRLVSRSAHMRYHLSPPVTANVDGVIIAGFLSGLQAPSTWSHFENDTEVLSGMITSFDPTASPFLTFIPPHLHRSPVELRWHGAGLMNIREYPIGDKLTLHPGNPLTSLLISDVHAVEGSGTNAYCWTRPVSRLRLPLNTPAAEYELDLRMSAHGAFSSSRVDVAIGEYAHTFWVTNPMASYTATFSGFESTQRWADLEIKSDAWSPVDFGSRDDRTLGVRWHGATWRRLQKERGR